MAIITHRGASSRIARFSSTQQQQQPEKKSNNHIFSPPPSLVPLGGGSSYTHTQSLVVDFLSYLDRKELPPFVCVRENVHSTPIIKDFNPEGQLYRNMCVQQQFRVCVI
jgi:hypothetical protein